MKHSQETFLQLVEEAYGRTLQLPAFQRKWKWKRNQVISLYDSLRKQFPIGSFLFVEVSKDYDLSPRPYEGSNTNAKSTPYRLTLDGQQRITSGIILLHAPPGSTRYFIDLNFIYDKLSEKKIDVREEEKVKQFVQELDDQDSYMVASTKKTELSTLLLENHWLCSIYLANKVAIQKALEPYEGKYADRRDFLKYIIVPYFTLENTTNHPVVTLTTSESLVAVTKIFATINTTGEQLTPVEIVTATLYSSHVNLKEDVETFRGASDYLTFMDKDGEILLQTIALLDNQTPKKSMLPMTIKYERYKDYYKDACDLLDNVGQFLTTNLGVGLDSTPTLLPYFSILAPMAACYKEIKNLKGSEKNKALDKLEKWFVGAALGQRYIQGAGNKQETDVKEMKKWIREDKDEFKPQWLREVHITEAIKKAPPNSAVGKLFKCLINHNKPRDPIRDIYVGYYPDANEPPQEHHIWAKKFCSDHIPDWNNNVDTCEYALNIMPVSGETNKKWTKMNPSDQVKDIKNARNNHQKFKEIIEQYFLSDECIKILEKPDHTKKDFNDFLNARFKLLSKKLAKWDFTIGEQENYEEESEISDT